MSVGRRIDYAVRALAYLAAQQSGRVVSTAEIQKRQGIPRHFLSKILRRMVAAGFLLSTPGARGGFRLRPGGEHITLRQVYECIEGPLALMECIHEEEGFCCFARVCTQIGAWRGAQEALGRYLEQVSIGDIADSRGLVPRLEKFQADGGAC